MPRFKFARGWSLERSTIDASELEEALEAAAFRPREIRREVGHFIVEASKR